MKYFLSTAGKKCCKGCTWLLSLGQHENGYDLIQIKRGLAEHRNLMRLQPGEPAVILDTGEFYIGDASGRPILINPSGAAMPQTDAILCVQDEGWSQGESVDVLYENLITTDGKVPNSQDSSMYQAVIILNDSIPVGIGFITDWQATNEALSMVVG